MSNRFFVTTGVVAALTISVSLQPRVQGQARRATAKAKSTAPLTPDGRPDLQGIWNFATLTPLERPDNLAGKQFLTDADVAEIEKRAVAQRADSDSPLPAGQVGGYNKFWMEPGLSIVPDRRTALIVDPPDGRIPALTTEALKRAAAHREGLNRRTEHPEQRDAAERCILGYDAGPPMVPAGASNGTGYNHYLQVIQTRDYVVLHTEMIHDARIVPLDARPHLPQQIRPWMGDSRGTWEGQTLVVRTTNFTDKTWNQFNRWNMASDENMKLVERFTRVDENTLEYEFTVDDPTTWTKPWTARIPMTKTKDQMFEYACHEGNYAMAGIMRGARTEEQESAEKARSGVR